MPQSTSNRARWFSTCTSCTPASASSPAGWRTVLTSIDVRVTVAQVGEAAGLDRG
jgi:hypothetical protein